MKNKLLSQPIILAIVYNSIDIKGVAAEPIIEEILFESKTISEDLVAFEEDVKASTIFTEASATAEMQPYTCGEPTAAGSLDAFDTEVTPVKVMYYQEFCPNNLRFTRFKKSMKPGAWETMSEEFERVVIGGIYAKKIALDIEAKFWSNVTPATKTAVAALTAGTNNNEVSTAEKTLVAATQSTAPFGLFDGIVQKMIFNASNAAHTNAVGGRLKVVGTTITSTNIKAEYDKMYAGLAPELFEAADSVPYIYAPYNHRQMISTYNNNPANPREAFLVSADGKKFHYNGVEIVFVPLPANVMIGAMKDHLIWATDLKSDIQYMKMEPIAANRDDWFIKSVMTIQTHVVNQRFNTLYVG